MILICNDFWHKRHKRKINNYDPCYVLLASFVLQGHIQSDIMRILRKKMQKYECAADSDINMMRCF